MLQREAHTEQGSKGSLLKRLAAGACRALLLGGFLFAGSDTVFAQDVQPGRKGKPDQAARDEAARVWAELSAAVKAGTMTRSEAKQKLDEYRAQISQPKTASKPGRNQAPNAEQQQGRAQAQRQQGSAPARRQAAAQRDAQASTPPGGRTLASVETALESAVGSGRMTQEEADRRLAVWKKNYGSGQPQPEARPASNAAERPNKARPQGKNAPQQAAAQRNARASNPSGGRTLSSVDAALETAVQAGRMTQEDADARLAAWKENYGSGQPQPEAKPSATTLKLRERLNKAVQEGRITQQQAADQMAAFQRRQSSGGMSDARLQLKQFRTRIDAAIVRGALRPEDVLKVLEPLRQRLRPQPAAARQARQKGRPQPKANRPNRNGPPVEARQPADPQEAQKPSELEKKISEINASVRAAKLTREEGFEQIEALRRADAEASAKPLKVDVVEIERKLNEAVERGSLSPTEAAKRLEQAKIRAIKG